MKHGPAGHHKRVPAGHHDNDASARPARAREAAAELYAGDPAVFIRRRGELAAQARASGDAAAAKEITGLRKPTRSAWVVNLLVRADPDVPSRLAALGTALREAGSSLDGRTLRELSRQRRELIATLTRQALAGQRDAPVSLQEEVSATLSAAVGDPGVAADLAAGALVRPAERSGFGLPGPGPPAASPPRPGRDRAARPGAAQAEQRDQERRRQAAAAAEQRDQERGRQAATAAEQAVREAEQAAAAARGAEQARADAVERLEHQLEQARDALAAARRASRAAAGALRGARRALDRLRAPDSR